ncbi:DNRLRE domain-containing protein [Nonomuraea typhae]|uniref:DNRLRE domain-containing protein n=1 Tax=Nonomuraea typhae TaxID=2603600 RepID=UPI0012F9EC14|nr:DNRLRE domain-containing protein [Nonomuraea typhae]
MLSAVTAPLSATPSAAAAAAPDPSTAITKAQSEAKSAGRQTEIPSLHTESSTTYANSDGTTLTTEFTADPVRVKQAGQWRPVDTTLISGENGISPRATKAGLALSAGGGPELLTMSSGNLKLFGPKDLPAPKLTGNRAEYANAYAPGIDLVVTATPSGFRQQIVIRQRPAGPLKLRVPVRLPSTLSFGKAASGKLALHDSAAKDDRELPAPLVVDAGADLSAGEEGRVGKAAATVENTGTGQVLTFVPDPRFLRDPGVTYPVTLSAVASDWTQLPVGNDTFVNNSAYQDGYANSGAYHLQAGKTNSGSVRWRTYIRFEEIPEDSPLRGGRVTNADLILWNIASNDCGERVGSGITARRVTQRWDVSTLTWNNQPAVTGEAANTEYGAYLPGCSRGYMDYEWDLYHYVNGIAQAWADGQPNYGFQLTAGNESDLTNWRAYRSKEWTPSGGSHGPKLVIGYEPAIMERVSYFQSRKPSEVLTDSEIAALKARETDTIPQFPAVDDEQSREGAERSESQVVVDAATLQPPSDMTPEQLEWMSDPNSGPGYYDGSQDPEVPPGPDTPPSVAGLNPIPDATDVPVETDVRVAFSEPVDGVQLTVKDAAGTAVPGRLTANEDKSAVTFDPVQPFTFSTRYTAEVSQARDVTGNVMTPYSWSFTTKAGTRPSGERARWRLDEGSGTLAADSTGNGHDATLTGTARWTTGRSGKALTNATPAGPQVTARSAAVPAVGDFIVDPSQSAGGSIVTRSLTPALRATVTEPSGGASTVEFRVLKYSDDSFVWSGSAANVASGAKASVTVPSGKLLDGTRYEWQVRASDAGGAASGWSAYQYFTADVPEAVVDEFQVTPSQVVNGEIVSSSLTPALRARVTDPLGGPATVAVEVARYSDDVVVWSGAVANVASGTQATVTVPAGRLLDGTRYEWRVKASTPGSTPAWSGWRYFTADVPEAVTDQFQVTPSETVGTATVTTSLTPALRARVTDPLGGPATVAVEVARYSDDVVVWSGSVANVASGTQATVTIPAGRLLDQTAYEFRVKATTPGSTPSWSGWQRFNTDVFDPARDPAVSQPQVVPSTGDNGGTVTSTVTPELRVSIAHPQAAPSRVEFELEHDPGAPQGQGSGQIWATALDNVASGTVAAVNVPAGKLADGWQVRWRARSLAGTASSTWSAWQQVKVVVPRPGVGQFQVTPAQVVDGRTVTTVATPALYAQVTYAPGGTLGAEFEIEHDPSASEGQGAGQIWAGAAENVPAGTQATVTVPAGKLTDGWQVRWRVRATTATSASPWSDWQHLTVDQPDSAPSVEELQVVPSAQADGVSVTPTLTPELRTTVLDPRGEPVQAEFEIEHDPSAPEGQGAGQIWAAGLDRVEIGSTAAVTVPPAKLSDGWAVRWRARAVSASAASPWSDWQRLSVRIPKPGVENLQVSPSSQVDGRTVTPVLTPSLRATASYAPGGALRAEFEIEHDPSAPGDQGTGQIWAGAVDGVPAGTQASVTVPAGKLTDGWLTRWRVRSVAGELTSAWSAWTPLAVKRPASAPTLGDLRVSPAHQSGGKTVTPSTTPTLWATPDDPRGDALTTEFEVHHDPEAPEGQGSGAIWTGDVPAVPAGSSTSVTLPDGELADGWLVRWRARAVSATAASDWSPWQQLKVDLIHAGEEPLARTGGPVVRTDQDYTVAAWVRWPDKDGAYTVVQQGGQHNAPFYLGNDPAHGLVFTLAEGDTAGAARQGVLSGVEAPQNQWFHLAGVYRAADNTASLYLDGKLVKSEEIGFPAWTADAPMTLGTQLIGDLDEVRVFGRSLSNDEIVAVRDGVETPAPAATAPAKQAAKPRSATPAVTAGNPHYEHCWRNEAEARKPSEPVYSTLRTPGGFHAGRNTWCAIQKIGSFGAHLRPGPRVAAEGFDSDATIIGFTWNTKPSDPTVPMRIRNFAFDISLDNFTFIERGNTAYRRWAEIEIGMKEATETGTRCQLISQQSHKAKWQEWDAGKEVTFVFASYEEDGAGTDKISWCHPRFYAKITRADTPLVKFTHTSDAYPQLRCDSAEYFKKTVGSGCVFDHAKLVYVTHEVLPGDPMKSSNLPDIKQEVKTAYRNVPSHIWTALHRPQQTQPWAENKSVPGYWGLGLVRSVNETWNAKNNNKVRKQCKDLYPEYTTTNAEIGKPGTTGNPPVPIPAKDRRVYECDEFPFESTIQGAWTSAEGKDQPQNRNYSIRPVYWRNNGDDGRLLRLFYELNRVLAVDGNTRKTEYDKFKVDPRVPQAPPIQ